MSDSELVLQAILDDLLVLQESASEMLKLMGVEADFNEPTVVHRDVSLDLHTLRGRDDAMNKTPICCNCADEGFSSSCARSTRLPSANGVHPPSALTRRNPSCTRCIALGLDCSFAHGKHLICEDDLICADASCVQGRELQPSDAWMWSSCWNIGSICIKSS